MSDIPPLSKEKNKTQNNDRPKARGNPGINFEFVFCHYHQKKQQKFHLKASVGRRSVVYQQKIIYKKSIYTELFIY